MTALVDALRSHPLCLGLADAQLVRLAACATLERHRAGAYLVREGASEVHVFLLLEGEVSLELARPGGAAAVVETLGAGDVLGVSSLTPEVAHLDARARTSVTALSLDNARLVAELDADPALGYAVCLRLLTGTYRRLARHRLQHLDVYG